MTTPHKPADKYWESDNTAPDTKERDSLDKLLLDMVAAQVELSGKLSLLVIEYLNKKGNE